MTVVETWLDMSIGQVTYEHGMMQKPSNNLSVLNESTGVKTSEEMLKRACALCSKACFVMSEENLNRPILGRECIGDASETALVKYIETRTDLGTLEDIRNHHRELYCIPFNSKNKWMVTINELETDPSKALVLMKGAPERVVSKCSTISMNQSEQVMDDSWKLAFSDANDYFASKGERVLGFAQLIIHRELVQKQIEREEQGNSGDSKSEEITYTFPLEGFTFIGMTALSDPPKVGVFEAIQKCKRAGIQVVMVTGDHPATAKAIAKQVGILDQDAKTIRDFQDEGIADVTLSYSEVEAVIVHGEGINELSEKDWRNIMKKKQVVFELHLSKSSSL